ncbi:MAG: M23 family metallopeptidase [Deltaproteobacteria bacterium]|nr:M23 family metallopeptidase [Deltaproteobacteria bacterium]
MTRINSRGKISAIASVAVLSLAGATLAQSVESVTPTERRADTVLSLDRSLGEVLRESERLDAQTRQVASEREGLPLRKSALVDRSRRDARRMYHLRQSAMLALYSGPASLLEHMGRVAHARRTLESSVQELGVVQRREQELVLESARIARELQSVVARRNELNARRQQAELLGPNERVMNANLGVAPLGEAVTVYGGRGGDVVSLRFEDAMGRLLLPIAGRSELRRVQREGAEGPGLEISAPLEAPVRAVFAGRVAFSDRYGVLGRLVILDHGNHYYTVSANLASATVSVGEELAAGAVIGTVGDDGRGPMLYFEVRHNSTTIDPAPWFGVQ